MTNLLYPTHTWTGTEAWTPDPAVARDLTGLRVHPLEPGGTPHAPQERSSTLPAERPSQRHRPRLLLGAAPGPRASELSILLSDLGYAIVRARDGFELINAWTFPWIASGGTVQPFSVIVVDRHLPLLDGEEAVAELQQFEGCHALCVVAPRGQRWTLERLVAAVPAVTPRGRACA